MTVKKTEIRRFTAVDDTEKKYTIIETEIITQSDEIRRDGMRAKGRSRKEITTVDGYPVTKLADSFKIGVINKIVWEV